jgi:phosphopantetheinyl transferase
MRNTGQYGARFKMTRHDNDRTRHYFCTSARDLTPAAACHAARVLYAPFASDPEIVRRCASALSDAELQRADRFVAESDKARFKQRRAFRRFCAAAALGSSKLLSRFNFEETENGRPYLPTLPDTWFSFSSCRTGLLGAWSSTHAIGVDVEDRTRGLDALDLARQFFADAEAQAVEGAGGSTRQHTFLQFWSLKEAALKSIGEGLSYGLDTFEFALAPRLRVVNAPTEHGGPTRFDAHMIDGTDGCTALVIRSRD